MTYFCIPWKRQKNSKQTKLQEKTIETKHWAKMGL